ncbi:MAG: YggS family pyridoxal phosphate-dependent enzyme [Clostridia bacterium]|nr:YggS family pyridoxal phosphate-dependent enzyme [Clostridia bacterium]
MPLKNNITDIHKRIEDACARSGRSTDEVTLICVSKTVSPEMIKEAQSLGENVFGENRPQELRDKLPLINGAQWHLIGHLQTNKVKYVVGNAVLIHSVDSLNIAEAINNEAFKKGIIQDILLEVNISGEESKYGLTTEQIPNIIKEVGSLKNIRFRGFMTMAPLGAPEEEIRSIFRQAHSLFTQYKDFGADILSMGMSGDFEIAVEEGATHIRVGSAIFKKGM